MLSVSLTHICLFSRYVALCISSDLSTDHSPKCGECTRLFRTGMIVSPETITSPVLESTQNRSLCGVFVVQGLVIAKRMWTYVLKMKLWDKVSKYGFTHFKFNSMETTKLSASGFEVKLALRVCGSMYLVHEAVLCMQQALK